MCSGGKTCWDTPHVFRRRQQFCIKYSGSPLKLVLFRSFRFIKLSNFCSGRRRSPASVARRLLTVERQGAVAKIEDRGPALNTPSPMPHAAGLTPHASRGGGHASRLAPQNNRLPEINSIVKRNETKTMWFCSFRGFLIWLCSMNSIVKCYLKMTTNV